MSGYLRNEYFFDFSDSHIKNFLETEQNLECVVVDYPERSDRELKFTAECHKGNEIQGSIYFTTTPEMKLIKQQNFNAKCFLREPQNQTKFDFKEYLRIKNIYTTCDTQNIEINESSEGFLLSIEKIKADLTSRIFQMWHQPHASLVLGLIIGDIRGIPADFEENLSNTSTSHIVAVSGFNVTVVINFLLKFAGVIPRKWAQVIAFIGLCLFLITVGLDNIPAFRAALIGFVVLFSKSLGRKSGFITMLFVSAAILIFINPLVFREVSFQLSYAATLGLYFFSEFIEEKISFIPALIKSEVSSSLAATISTLPIILIYFGKISIFGIMINTLVLPMVPYSMILGTIFFVLIFINFNAGFLFGIVPYFLLDIIIKVINFAGSNLPTTMVENGGFIFYLLLASVFAFTFYILIIHDKADFKL